MKIDIDQLTEKELIELNHRIVERLKFIQSMYDHAGMMEFNIGEKVCFSPSGREERIGVLVKFNKKTVTIVTEQGERWNVSPHFLSKVENEKTKKEKKDNLIELKGRQQ